MRFSELTSESWAELETYLDTCLLPVSGLTGEETPPEAAVKIASAGEWLAPLEQSFNGRTVTLPAYHYWTGSEEDAKRLNAICERMKRNGFRYAIVVCGQPSLLPEGLWADLIVQPADKEDKPDREALRKAVSELWRKGSKPI